MPVRVEINLVGTGGNMGTDITYQAIPEGDPTQDEIVLANTIVAVCNLLSDRRFMNHIDPWVEKEIEHMRDPLLNDGNDKVM